jgi:hypothetical protein
MLAYGTSLCMADQHRLAWQLLGLLQKLRTWQHHATCRMTLRTNLPHLAAAAGVSPASWTLMPTPPGVCASTGSGRSHLQWHSS